MRDDDRRRIIVVTVRGGEAARVRPWVRAPWKSRRRRSMEASRSRDGIGLEGR
jgi:hypothetical protein